MAVIFFLVPMAFMFTRYVLTSRSVYEVQCTSFNCTLNQFGVCKTSLVADLFFNCYPIDCAKGGVIMGNFSCYLSQHFTYPCSSDGYGVNQCFTPYYTYVGEGNLMLYLGVIHLALRYIHISVIGIIFLFYKILTKLSPVAQVRPLYSLIIVIVTLTVIWDYYPLTQLIS